MSLVVLRGRRIALSSFIVPLDEGKMLEEGAHARRRSCAALP
jgi:hypothetical protein